MQDFVNNVVLAWNIATFVSNQYLRLEIVDPWDPMEFKYKKVIVEREEEIDTCKSVCYIKYRLWL
jgi:hypothetical protein